MGTKKGWHCHWVWTSFGLPAEYKLSLHEEVFNLCYYGNGGFTHTQVYNMPVYLRRFYIKKIIDVKKQEADQQENSTKMSKTSTAKIDRPAIRR